MNIFLTNKICIGKTDYFLNSIRNNIIIFVKNNFMCIVITFPSSIFFYFFWVFKLFLNILNIKLNIMGSNQAVGCRAQGHSGLSRGKRVKPSWGPGRTARLDTPMAIASINTFIIQ